MPHLDETSRGWRPFYCSDTHTHDIAAGRQFLFRRRNNDATGTVRDLQVSAAISMRQGCVVFVIGQVGAIILWMACGCFLRVAEAEVFWIGSPLQSVGKAIRPDRVRGLRFRFAKFRHPRLVLGSRCRLVDALLPAGEASVGIFDLCDFFFVRGIDRLLRLDADKRGFRRRSLRDWTFQLDPIDPDGGRCAVSVLFLVAAKILSDEFLRLSLAFLYAEFARRVCADLDIELNDFGVLNGAGYRLRAEQFGEAA